jgi:pimeloyl-ACP methyl ester carboxylesterase
MPFDAEAAGRPRQDRRRRNTVIGALIAVLVMLFSTAAAGTGSASGRSADKTLPGFQQGFVPVSGGTIHYVRGGSGPVLVLLHGWPETWWAWRKVMPALALTHTVVAFDLPGLGESSVPTGGFDADTTAQRIREAVQGLGYQQVQILGHDLGTLVAYDYARDHPAEVTRLGVMESPLNGFGLEGAYGLSWHFLFNQTARPIPETLIDNQQAVRTYLGFLFDEAAHYPQAVDQPAFFEAYSDPANREAGYGYYRAFPANAANNVANASERLTMPVLAMGAQYTFGPAIAASFQKLATDVHGVVAPDSGHFIAEENPTFLAACANLFFGSPSTTPPPADLTACVP